MTETITYDEFSRRIVELYVKSGLRSIPRRVRDKHILLKSITLTFDMKAQYTEAEVNEKLEQWRQSAGRTFRRLDYVNLRRLLIDGDYLGRSNDGSRYWVGIGVRNHPVFEPDIDSIDVPKLIEASREEIERRKREFLQRQ